VSRLRALALGALGDRLGEAEAGRALAALAPSIAALPNADAPVEPGDLAQAHESSLPASVRRACGAYYTPAPIVDLLLADVPAPIERIIDPSCGGGAFLGPATRLTPASEIHGVDTDPIAVEIARLAILVRSGCDPELIEPLRRNIRCAEALVSDLSNLEGSFDAVVGNPPFVDSESMSRHSSALRAAVRARYATARGNWDLSVPFVELALRLARPGGTIALVVPRQILGSDYAAELHRLLLRHEIVAVRDLDAPEAFDGAAAPVALLTVRKRAPAKGHRVHFVTLNRSVSEVSRTHWAQSRLEDLPPGHITAPFSADAAPLLARFNAPLRLLDIATVCDGATTAEAYDLRDALREATDDELNDPGSIRLVNSGTIDPFTTLWGARSTVYLKRRLARPVIDREALARIAPRRLVQADRPKVVVAGLCRRIEAVALSGGWLCAKSAVLILPREGVCPHALAAYLNAPTTTALHRAVFSGRSLGRGALHIAPRQLERLPVPGREALAPGSELSDLGRSSPPPTAADLDRVVSALFDEVPAGTICSP